MARRVAVVDPPEDPNAREPEPQDDAEPETADGLTGLEVFDDADASNVTSYFYRLANDGEPESGRHGYCHKVVGVIDPDALALALGGGRYRVIQRKGRRMENRTTIRIAGPPKVYPVESPAATPAALAPATPPAALEPEGFAKLRLEVERLAQLVAGALTARGSGSSADELLKLAQAARLLQPEGTSIQHTLGLVDRAVEAGRKMAGAAADGDDTGSIVRDLLRGVLQGFAARPAVPQATGAPAAAPTMSSATVLDTAEDLIKLFVRLFTKGMEPDDAAEVVEDVLSEGELVMLRAAPLAPMLEQLRAATPKANPEARAALDVFAERTLNRIQHPAPDEGEGAA